jgi:uncharacterized delta-60 repeat protein
MNVRRYMGGVLALSILVGTGLPQASAVDGGPDPSFGNDGVVSAPISGFSPVLVGLADGSVVGAAADGNDLLQLFKLNVDGSPDPAFGDAGIALVKVGQYPSAGAILELPSGAIAVVGSTVRRHGGDASTEHGDLMVARFTASGTLDPSFSSDGLSFVDFGGDEGAWVAHVDGDGRLTVIGSDGERLLLTRLRHDGFRDRTFGLDGKIAVPVAGSIHNIVLDGAQRVVVGYSTGRRIVLERFLPDGSRDPTFTPRPTKIKRFMDGLSVDDEGRIVAVGTSHGRVGVARFTSAGVVDRRFHDDGWRTFSVGEDPSASGVVVQRNGRIVVGVTAGFSPDELDRDVALVRLTNAGRIDRSFSRGGIAITDLGGTDILRGMRLTPDRKLLTTGEAAELSPEPRFDLFVMRSLLR